MDGFGGWSVGLEAALTSYEAAGKYIKYSERPTMRYDDNGDGKDVGFRLLLLAAVIIAARALPPQNKQTSNRRMTNNRGAGRKYSQLRVVQRHRAP